MPLTLLVVTLEVPRTYGELVASMRGFPAFAASFLALLTVWNQHVTFFRRYALQDRVTVGLNGVLLFCVLFYVYPLKFMMSLVGDLVLGQSAALGDAEMMNAMALMFGGLGAVLLVFGLLHANALRHRVALGLIEREARLTRLQVVNGVASAALMLIAILVLRTSSAAAAVVPLVVVPGSLWLRRAATRVRRETPPPDDAPA